VQYEEAHNNVAVDSGLFNVVIGSETPPDPGVFAIPMWVEIVVDGEALSPRQKVLGAPYAMSL